MNKEDYSKYYIQGSDHYLIPKDELVCLLKEIKELQSQLKYLRSGEYYNQLRFENEMLQNVVDTNGVPSEVYDYIECTHRNTELLKENQQLKKQLQQKENIINKTKDVIEQMLTTGYSKGLTYYYPAKNGEFGIRAKVLLEILDNKGDENDG